MAETIAANPPISLSVLLRQAGVLVALAASVALGLYVVLWSRTPEYSVLYSDLSERDLSQVIDALSASDTPYRIDHRSGVVLVTADTVHETRLKLAAAGLPKSAGMGFEMLEQEQNFGTSQFIEKARYQRAIEGELSRSIARINNVRSARIHLALPRQSAFSRARREPTASVIVDLYNGRRLEAHQVGAIVHMVSASIPSMTPDHVTVIDQQGNLLSDGHGSGDELVVTAKRFEYVQRLEKSYIERVEAILMPFVGADGVRAQVTADIDFTASEQTRESFNPDLPAVRSESLLEEERRGAGNMGIPGALSNEPPLPSEAPEELARGDANAAGTAEAGAESATAAGNRRSQTTRNYELDRTIAHTKPAIGNIRRLSVAVVLRKPAAPAAPENAEPETPEQEQDQEQEPTQAASPDFSPEQLERMENLVKEAIGFDAARGDSVSLTSADFLAPEASEPIPELPLWEQPWVWSVAKQALGGLFVLFIVLGVIRPAVKSLVSRPMHQGEENAGGELQVLDANGNPTSDSVAALPNAPGTSTPLLASSDISPDLPSVKEFAGTDPKIAAQVLKGWVGE